MQNYCFKYVFGKIRMGVVFSTINISTVAVPLKKISMCSYAVISCVYIPDKLIRPPELILIPWRDVGGSNLTQVL